MTPVYTAPRFLSRFLAWLSLCWTWVRTRVWFARHRLNGRILPRRERHIKPDGGRLFYRPGMKPPKGYSLNGRGDLVSLRRERMRRGVA